MSSRLVFHSILEGHSIGPEARARIGERLGSAGRAATRVWSMVRGTAGVVLALLLAFAAVAAMLWLLYELASWWVRLAAQPFVGSGAGLEDLFR